MNAADKLKQYVAEVYRLQSRRAWTTPLHHGHRLHLELCPKMHLLKEEWVIDGGRIMGFIRNAGGIDRTDYNIDEQTYICKLIAAHGCEHGLTQSEVKKIAWYLYLSPFPYKWRFLLIMIFVQLSRVEIINDFSAIVGNFFFPVINGR